MNADTGDAGRGSFDDEVDLAARVVAEPVAGTDAEVGAAYEALAGLLLDIRTAREGSTCLPPPIRARTRPDDALRDGSSRVGAAA